MTDSQLRDIFSRFESLNLVNLRHSLVSDKYAIGGWSSINVSLNYVRIDLCPLGHGQCLIGVCVDPDELLCDSNRAFWRWFDGVTPGVFHLKDDTRCRVARLLRVIDDIWRERLDDANCVQNVIRQDHGFVAQLAERPALNREDSGSFPDEAFVCV